MKGYLFDTVTCSRLRRRDKAIIQRLTSLPTEATVHTSVITVGELVKGIHLAPPEHREKLRRQVEELLAQFPILEVTREVAEKYGEIVAKIPPGWHVGQNDYWIAAIAMIHDLVLVTSDPDFERIDGLARENWLAKN